MEFKDFKEKYYGKDYDFIKEGLKEEKNLFKDVESVQLIVDAGMLIQEVMDYDRTFPALFIFRKDYAILMYIYKKLFGFDISTEDEDFDNYDFNVEKVTMDLFSKAAYFKKVVEEGIKINENIMVIKLYDVFKDGLPTVEEMDNLQKSMSQIFENTSENKLETIQNILSFNDPALQEIKHIVYDGTKETVEKELNKNK